ncbi:MAG: hypothetical protein ACFFCO_05490, partial [Promethearchaeota archaeon]
MSPRRREYPKDRTSYYSKHFFKDLEKEVAATARECEMYGDLCKGQRYDFQEPITHKNLHTVPFIPTQFFKVSLEQYFALLRVPREQIVSYHVSSSTSEDPSVVGRTASDITQIKENWVTAWRKFLNLEKTDYCLNFAPGHIAMKAVARRSGAEVKGRRLYVDFINAIMDPYVAVEYTVKLRFWKTIAQVFRFRIKAVAEICKKTVLKMLRRRKGTECLILGGNPLLMNRLLTTEFKGEEHPLGEYGWVGTGGGGWDGVKAQIKMEPLGKPEFMETIQRIFHIPMEHFRDNYTFTETPSAFLGHWSKKHEDIVMHVPPTSKIVVRHQKTLEPVKPGAEGLLEVLTPYGVQGAAC